ncbi:MAG: HlyD family efflux transporter periplasmic adaptor subunit [Pirellulaceae bacterium]|nr:HlyD family efflux transporter periplasmic adaptor subunit [Pirellulaceae bacterium]
MFKRGVHAVVGLIVPLLLVATGVGFFLAVKAPEPAKIPKLGSDEASLLSVMPAAQVETVRALTDSLDIAASGVVVPYREILLAAEVSGRVVDKDISVRPGNHVHQGQVLLKIDPRDYEYEIERLTQRLNQEQVALRENEQELQNTQRLLELAQAQYELAEADFKRTAELKQNFASLAELGAAKQQMLSSMNQRVTLTNQADSLRTRRQRLELAGRMAETELLQARLNLQRTEISSPVDGIVVREQIERDSYVQRGTNLLTIEDISKAEVSCSLRMDQLYWILDQNIVSHDRQLNSTLATLQKPPPVEAEIVFRLGGRHSAVYQWKGKLDRFDGSGLDPQNRMVPLRIVVDRPSEYLLNGTAPGESSMSLVRGMFVDVILKAKPATQLMLIPKLGVKPATDAHRVWKFEPDKRAFEVVQGRHSSQSTDDGGQPSDPSKQLRPTLVSDRAGDDTNPTAPKRPDPERWQAGFLKVLEGVEVVGAYIPPDQPDKEYLVCDVGRADIHSGDFVVVTPIPGVETVEVPIRVTKESLTPPPTTTAAQ